MEVTVTLPKCQGRTPATKFCDRDQKTDLTPLDDGTVTRVIWLPEIVFARRQKTLLCVLVCEFGQFDDSAATAYPLLLSGLASAFRRNSLSRRLKNSIMFARCRRKPGARRLAISSLRGGPIRRSHTETNYVP